MGRWSYTVSRADTALIERASLLTQEEARAGNTLASVETCDETEQQYSMQGFLEEHPATFFQLAQRLEPFDRDLLFSYLLLQKTQGYLGKVFGGISQSNTASLCREATAMMASLVVFSGDRDTTPIIEKALKDVQIEQPKKWVG